MVDYLGNEIRIGDEVVSIYAHHLEHSLVYGFTAKRVQLGYGTRVGSNIISLSALRRVCQYNEREI